MKLLLDTHIWLWAVEGPERLRPRVLRALQNQANQLWLSPMSLVEMGMLIAKGRLALDRGLQDWLAHARDRVPTLEAPVTMAIAESAASWPAALSDPADRLIAATAKVLALTLVTADKRLIGLPGLHTLSNR